MSRRKKQAGFSPREKAREEVRSIMRGINTTEHQFDVGSKQHAEKIDIEMKRLATLQGESLRAYLEQWLRNSQAAFLGAIQDFKQRLAVTRTEADEKAVKLMDVINNHKWDQTKDIVGVAIIELAGYEIDVDGLAHETLVNIIDSAASYEQRRECVRTGLRNNWTADAILEKLHKMDENAASAVQGEPEVEKEVTEDALVKKETVNVD